MSNIVHRAVTGARGAALLIAAVPCLLLVTGCTTPAACVSGIGVCKSPSLRPSYVVIDPSGSEAGRAARQVSEVEAVASRGPTDLTVVLLGERPSTSTLVTRVALPKVDASDPNAVTTRTALLAKLDSVVRHALAQRTHSSDQFGALELVHDDAEQRGSAGADVFVLGDSEPCVPGVCWTHAAPTPDEAVKQVQAAYSKLQFGGENVTFVVGGDNAASRKTPSYVVHLSAADLAVCRWAGAQTCKTSTEVSSQS